MHVNTLLVIWILIGAAGIIIDLATNAFLFIWFTIGAIAAVVAQLLHYGTVVQIITFCVVSSVFTAVGYPLVKKTIKRTVSKTPTMEEGYINREFVIDEEIIQKALIKIDGIYWTVKNEGNPVKKGDKVKITGIEGNKIKIKKIMEE